MARTGLPRISVRVRILAVILIVTALGMIVSGTTAYLVQRDRTIAGLDAELLATVRKSGSGIAMADACIAATAFAHGLTVATRDTSPYLAAGLRVINPWD